VVHDARFDLVELPFEPKPKERPIDYTTAAEFDCRASNDGGVAPHSPPRDVFPLGDLGG